MENNNQPQNQQSASQPEQPTSNQPVTSIQNNPPAPKSKLPLMLIVLIILVLTLVGGAYYYLGIKNKKNQQDKPCPVVARICNDGTTAKPGPNCTQTCPEDSTSPTPTTIISPAITQSLPTSPPIDYSILSIINTDGTKDITIPRYQMHFKLPQNWSIQETNIRHYNFTGSEFRKSDYPDCADYAIKDTAGIATVSIRSDCNEGLFSPRNVIWGWPSDTVIVKTISDWQWNIRYFDKKTSKYIYSYSTLSGKDDKDNWIKLVNDYLRINTKIFKVTLSYSGSLSQQAKDIITVDNIIASLN